MDMSERVLVIWQSGMKNTEKRSGGKVETC